MLETIGRTWSLTQRSWAVLQKDRELIAFPFMAVIAAGAVIGVFFLIALATGSVDALLGTEDPITGDIERNYRVIDGVVLVLATVSIYFVMIFFNAALIAAAIERLRGGDPTIGSGLRAIVPYTANILGWAIIAASVGLILSLMRERAGLLGRIAIAIVGGVWAYLTFFVVPYLVVQGLSPFAAIRESSSLFKRTWGEQVTSNIGFTVVYIAVALVLFLPAAALFLLNPILGVVAGLVLFSIGFATVMALEAIFRAALFEYAANGVTPEGFDGAELHLSYSRKDE